MEIAIRREEGFAVVTLAGVINEDNALADRVVDIPGSLLLIRLRDVELINSCGVRDWVNWIKALEAKGAEVLLLECSPAIVSQINAVNNFTGAGAVKSFYLPYFCATCNIDQLTLCEAAVLLPPALLPPISRCQVCGNDMEFDDLPSAYFLFLSNPKKVATPNKIPAAALRFFAPDPRTIAGPGFGDGSDPIAQAARNHVESKRPPFLAIGVFLVSLGIFAYLFAYSGWL